MVPNWVASQQNAFMRWCNMYLSAQDRPQIKDLATDMSDGVQLCHLVQIITNQKLGKIIESPKYLESFENVNLALDHIKHQHVNISGIGAEDIVDGNLKLILGLIWQLILRYTVNDIQEEGVSARDGLLLWCRRKALPYGVEINDFSRSWKSGLAMCALMDHYRPDLLDFDQFAEEAPIKCVEAALAAAKEVGIPELVEPQEIVDGADEKSLITYIAYWYHCFNDLDRIETAGRRVEGFFSAWSLALRLKKEYESRMQKLLESIKDQCVAWADSNYETHDEITAQYASLKEFKTTKRKWSAEKAEVIQLLGNIRVKLGTYGFAQYTPPLELSLDVLNAQWLVLLGQESMHSKFLAESLHDIKEKLRKEFAERADTISSSLYALNIQMCTLEGDLDAQLTEIMRQSEELTPLKNSIAELSTINEKCKALGVEDNDYTIYTFEDLEYEMKLATKTVSNKLAFVENQMVARQMSSNITPTLLDEFESTFRHFDRSNKNRLQRDEFLGALASLGTSYGSDELDKVFDSVKDQDNCVSFRGFITYMVSVSEDKTSIDQLRSSFQELSHNKSFVTRGDLEDALLSDDVIESLVTSMEETSEGYDFEKYLEELSISMNGEE